MPNCSATTSGAWFGSMTPPDPIRMVEVDAARWAARTAGAALATPGIPWCSATQTRESPAASATWAMRVASTRAWAGVAPAMTVASSCSDRATIVLDPTGGPVHRGPTVADSRMWTRAG